jgi:transmembrane sensor
MPTIFSVEELMIDDSFCNYCLQKNEADILRWEEYTRVNPNEKETVEEAKQLVLGLTAMLQLEKTETPAETVTEPAKVIALPDHTNLKKSIKWYTIGAAAAILLFIGLRIYFSGVTATGESPAIGNKNNPGTAMVFTTGNGEKKLIVLPDSTKLWLNAGTTLRLDNDFGKTNRAVFLTGEALFDVTHDASFPFIVHMDKYDVKVLGTLFNVKAYAGDKQSETSLIRGKVEIQIASSHRKILLWPNQKVVINNNEQGPSVANKDNPVTSNEVVAMLPLSYNEKDNTLIETAWSQNRLEIVDESFADIKDKLERWFDVKINFRDDEVSRYRFTATFEKETTEQVLKALQNAYHFNYEFKESNIVISK